MDAAHLGPIRPARASDKTAIAVLLEALGYCGFEDRPLRLVKRRESSP